MSEKTRLLPPTWSLLLFQARTNRGLSLRSVEIATGVSNAYVSQMESGKVDAPGFFKLMRLLEFYDIGPVEFYEKYK